MLLEIYGFVYGCCWNFMDFLNGCCWNMEMFMDVTGNFWKFTFKSLPCRMIWMLRMNLLSKGAPCIILYRCLTHENSDAVLLFDWNQVIQKESDMLCSNCWEEVTNWKAGHEEFRPGWWNNVLHVNSKKRISCRWIIHWEVEALNVRWRLRCQSPQQV